MGRLVLCARLIFNNRLVIGRASARNLFSESSLRMDGFLESRETFMRRVRRKDDFWKRISELQKGRTVYEQDLKTVCYTAEKENMSVLKDLLVRYFTNTGSRLGGDFKLGPVVMRLCHFLNDSDTALEVFNDKRIQHIFFYQSAILVFLDLLFQNKLYKEVVTSFENVIALEWPGSIKSRAIPLPYVLSLYVLGGPESLEKAVKFIDGIPSNHFVLRRMPLATAGLALKCDKPLLAVKYASPYPSYYLSYNIIIQGYAKMKDWNEVLSILSKHSTGLSLLKDTREIIASSVKDNDKFRVKVLSLFSKSSDIDKTVDDLLLAPVEYEQYEATKMLQKRADNVHLLELRNAFKERQ